MACEQGIICDSPGLSECICPGLYFIRKRCNRFHRRSDFGYAGGRQRGKHSGRKSGAAGNSDNSSKRIHVSDSGVLDRSDIHHGNSSSDNERRNIIGSERNSNRSIDSNTGSDISGAEHISNRREQSNRNSSGSAFGHTDSNGNNNRNQQRISVPDNTGDGRNQLKQVLDIAIASRSIVQDIINKVSEDAAKSLAKLGSDEIKQAVKNMRNIDAKLANARQQRKDMRKEINTKKEKINHAKA